ncbi:RNA-binding domain-containing protein [Meredithblackwellia eburnea MCA 4105]
MRGRARSRSPPPPSKSIVVQRLTKNVQAAHLEEIFEAYGKITDVDLPIVKRLGTHKGTAYITFATTAAADKAVEYMDRGQLDGSTISVFLEPPSPGSRSRSPTPPPRRQSTNNNYRGGGGGGGGGRVPLPARAAGVEAGVPSLNAVPSREEEEGPDEDAVFLARFLGPDPGAGAGVGEETGLLPEVGRTQDLLQEVGAGVGPKRPCVRLQGRRLQP